MAEQTVMSKAELLGKMQAGWRDFNAYLKTLSEAQMTAPRDAVGWTVRDHLIHLVAWEDGVSALLNGQSRREAMNVDEATWQGGDFDKINAVIQEHYKDMPLAQVLGVLRDAHERMMGAVQGLSSDDLHLPYRHWQPSSTSENSIMATIISDSYEHYEEHTPWIDAIVKTAT